ncbi:MAG: SDR family NAD(P)-dependent oxidoreductase [Steroidobacteraceae bacterium]|jgi:NADP-dependent 3-hydroxy acid dehydrogenase YdfG|nr:SDR family NAD(P)-dependent oxidoreductase [Steroidobacteraceae bacterium]
MNSTPGTQLAAALPGRRAFLTGAASGLGLALANELARAGWTLGLLDRDAVRLAGVAATLRAAGAPDVHAFPGDVTDEAAFTAVVAEFAMRTGGLDLMVNDAGVAVAGRFESTPLADWRWALDVNVLGVVVGCRAAVPILRRQGTGLILNVASAAGFASGPQMSAYNASKAAVISITETLVQEFLFPRWFLGWLPKQRA